MTSLTDFIKFLKLKKKLKKTKIVPWYSTFSLLQKVHTHQKLDLITITVFKVKLSTQGIHFSAMK